MQNIKSDEEIFILNNQYCVLDDFLHLPENSTVELDLGCGKGDFSVGLAAIHPERYILAADVMMGRLRKVLKKSGRNGTNNVFFLRVEARQLVTRIIPDGFIDRLHVLCPDPWPKDRHRGNRLLSSDIMGQFARILKQNGILHFASDDVPYWNETIKNIEESGLFRRAENETVLADVKNLKTEFERRWLAEGKTVPHIAFQKL